MKFITLVSVTLFVICGTFSSAVAADWISVYSQGGVDYYYDRKSITYDDNERIKVDTKTFFEYDAVKETFIKERRDAGLSTEGWNKLRYFISRIEINCSSKRVNFLSDSTYDDWDNLLTSHDKANVQAWIPIADNSLLMFTYNAVCGVR
ncbi:MAG: surface-adhesin E family protein [Thermodesulfobacteriota bacterium]